VIRSALEAWNRYWFSPASATTLGVCRFITCAHFLNYFWSTDLALWGAVPNVLWMPIYSFQLLQLPHASAATLGVLQIVWKTSLATGALGLFTRLSTSVSCVLGFYLIGLTHSFGKTDHADTVVPLLLLVLACSRCGDAFSFDRRIRAWRRRNLEADPGVPSSGAYAWPIKTVWMLLGLVFGAAGISKIRNGGVDWIISDSMRNILLKHHYAGYEPASRIGLVIAEYPWVYKPMAAAGMILETLAPLGMLSRIARVTIIPGLLAMILLFRVTHGFSPRPYYAMFAWFIPWSELFDTLRNAWLAHRPEASR